jgi:hypothetical protein
MKTMLLMAIVAIWFAYADNNELTGIWETKPSPKGNITRVIFKPDASFEGFINKKPFTSGKYTFHDGLLSFTENGCNGKRGEYKIIFFSHSDSIRFVPVNDSCEERRKGMSVTILGRIK